jgi:hypothetical protein
MWTEIIYLSEHAELFSLAVVVYPTAMMTTSDVEDVTVLNNKRDFATITSLYYKNNNKFLTSLRSIFSNHILARVTFISLPSSL